MHGQACRQGGVDCVRFVVAVLDELFGIAPDEAIPVLPKDTAWHNAAGVVRVVRALERRYPHEIVREGPAEPGDVLIARVSSGNPGHIGIVGPKPGTVWHSNPGVGVAEVGFGVFERIENVWRPKGKAGWLQHSSTSD